MLCVWVKGKQQQLLLPLFFTLWKAHSQRENSWVCVYNLIDIEREKKGGGVGVEVGVGGGGGDSLKSTEQREESRVEAKREKRKETNT